MPAALKNFERCEISAELEKGTKILNSSRSQGSFPNLNQTVSAQGIGQALLENQPREETGNCTQREPVKLDEAGAHR